MNSNHYFSQLINAIENGSLTNLDDVKTNTSDTATNTADIVTNTGILADCVDQVNHHLEVDTNAINGVTMAVNSGNNSDGCQRFTIANDDTIKGPIHTAGTLTDVYNPGTTKCFVMGGAQLDGKFAPVTLSNSGYIQNDITKINGVAVDVSSGNLSTGSQRVCIATDDINMGLIKNYICDQRINSNIRGKIAGGTSARIAASGWSPAVEDGANNLLLSDLSPCIAQMYIVSSSANDTSAGSGCRSVRLIYINSSGSLLTADVSTNGGTNVNIGTDVREIVNFYGLTFGATGSNEGIIYLRNNHDDKNAAWIRIGYNSYSSLGIDVPQNGYTYIKHLSLNSAETNNPNTNFYVALLLIQRTATTYTYKYLFESMCSYTHSNFIDLSSFPPISGSGSSSVNYTLYPVVKSAGVFDTNGSVSLTALNM